MRQQGKGGAIVFAIQDRVNYGAVGVCTVVDIRREKIGGGAAEYYVLEPIFQPNATVYVPVNNAELTARMRALLSEEEIQALIREMPAITAEWIPQESERTSRFKEALRSGDRRRLVALIKSVYQHREEMALAKRHIRASDAILMKEAETLLYSEMAFVLGMRPDEVLPMLKRTLSEAG